MASLKKRPDGKWRARYRDQDGKEHARHFRRQIDGQRWLDEVTASVVTGHYVDPDAGRLTLEAWAEQWAGRQVWADGTRTSAAQAVASAPFRGLELRRIHRSHVEAWIRNMAESLAPSTIRTRYNYVSMALRAAVRDKIIATDPSAGVKLPRQRRAEHAMSIPSTSQVRAALEHAPAEYRAAVAVCAFAGLRLGEMAGLRAGDVDAGAGLLEVRRQVQGTSAETTVIVPPKAGSERVIPIPSDLAAMLETHVQAIGTIRAERYLFFRGGDLLNRQSASHIWRGIRKRADIPSAFTLHSLRHYYASALIAAGCDVVTVQRALGHAQPSITLNTYSHLWDTAEDRTRDAAADLMRATLEP